MNVVAERFASNTQLEVSWTAINSPQLLAYEIEYRVYIPDLSDFPSTIVKSPGTGTTFTITDVDGDTNYEVRVRAIIEITGVNLIKTTEGNWSPWTLSRVKPDQGL